MLVQGRFLPVYMLHIKANTQAIILWVPNAQKQEPVLRPALPLTSCWGRSCHVNAHKLCKVND